MNGINKNLNNYNMYNVGFKSEAEPQAQSAEVQLPDMYYMPDSFEKPTDFKGMVKKVDMMNLVSPWLEHPIAMLGLCTGMSVGIDAIEKTFNKDYEKSSLSKAAKFGDKIEKSKFIQSKPMQTIFGGIGKGWTSIKNFAMKSSIVSSMVKTPSKPKCTMPKDELLHTEQRTVQKFREICSITGLNNAAQNSSTKAWSLNDIAPTKAEKEGLKKFYNTSKLSSINENELVNRLTLQRLGKSEADISRILQGAEPEKETLKAVIKSMGLTDAELEHIMKKDDAKAIELTKKASENLKNLKFAKNKGMFSFLSKIPVVSKLFSNTTGFGEVYNRIHSLTDGAETKTGRFMSRLLQKVYRGFTFGGGKTGILFFVTPFLLETLRNTKKAGSDEKVGTFMQGSIDSISWVFTFPLVLKAIYALGGIQKAGMSDAQLAEEERLYQEFADSVKNGDFKTNKEHRAAKKELRKKLKANRVVKDQSLFVRLLRKLSAFTKADLNKVPAYQGENAVSNFFRRIPNSVGYGFFYSFARVLVFFLVGMPIVDKIIKKITSALFGRSRDEFKEQEYEEAKKAQEEYTIKDLKERMLEIQANKINPQAGVLAQAVPSAIPASIIQNSEEQKAQEAISDVNKPENLNSQELNSENIPQPIDENVPVTAQNEQPKEIAKKEPVQNLPNQEIIKQNTAQAALTAKNPINNVKKTKQKTDTYTYIPSQDSVFNSENKNPANVVNKYIPAQTPVQVTKTFDNSAIEAAMRRASRAEQKAMQTLAGNFGSSS